MVQKLKILWTEPSIILIRKQSFKSISQQKLQSFAEMITINKAAEFICLSNIQALNEPIDFSCELNFGTIHKFESAISKNRDINVLWLKGYLFDIERYAIADHSTKRANSSTHISEELLIKVINVIITVQAVSRLLLSFLVVQCRKVNRIVLQSQKPD